MIERRNEHVVAVVVVAVVDVVDDDDIVPDLILVALVVELLAGVVDKYIAGNACDMMMVAFLKMKMEDSVPAAAAGVVGVGAGVAMMPTK